MVIPSSLGIPLVFQHIPITESWHRVGSRTMRMLRISPACNLKKQSRGKPSGWNQEPQGTKVSRWPSKEGSTNSNPPNNEDLSWFIMGMCIQLFITDCIGGDTHSQWPVHQTPPRCSIVFFAIFCKSYQFSCTKLLQKPEMLSTIRIIIWAVH